MCAKHHNRPLLTWFIRANIVTSPTVVSGQRSRLTLTFFCTLCVIFRWCYINEYCKCCLIATAMKFYTNNFTEYIYKEISNYCWLLLITGLNLKSKSFTTYRVTVYYTDRYQPFALVRSLCDVLQLVVGCTQLRCQLFHLVFHVADSPVQVAHLHLRLEWTTSYADPESRLALARPRLTIEIDKHQSSGVRQESNSIRTLLLVITTYA